MNRFLLHLVKFPYADTATISSEFTPSPGSPYISLGFDCKSPSSCRNFELCNTDLPKSKNMILVWAGFLSAFTRAWPHKITTNPYSKLNLHDLCHCFTALFNGP